MTQKELVEFVLENGQDIDVVLQKEVVVGTEKVNGEYCEIKEIHDFKYTLVSLHCEDITEKKRLLEAELAKIS